MNDYLVEPFLTKFKRLIETLLEEIRAVIKEKNGIENQLWFVRVSAFDANNQMTGIFISYFYRCKVIDCELHEGNQTCGYGKTPFR